MKEPETVPESNIVIDNSSNDYTIILPPGYIINPPEPIKPDKE